MTTVNHTLDSAQDTRAIGRSAGRVDVIALGWSLSIFLAASVLLCVVGGYILPPFITHFLAAAFPAYDWRDPKIIAFATGLAFFGGWYAAVVAGALYNYFLRKR
jgi:phosphotransferase system  glucose/maltose/N-acetylglucosamine-specific IIC component